MITAIAFDYGGVIEISEKSIVQEIVSYLGIQRDQWLETYFSLNHLCNTGKYSWKEVMVLTAEKVGATKQQIPHIENLLLRDVINQKLNFELIEKIKNFKPMYKTALVSNYTTGLRQKLIDQKIIDLFDEVIISGEVGYQKPQPEIFMLTCEKLGVPISELVFIDDTPRSLENATEIGYTPILYIDNQKLQQDLNLVLTEKI